MFADDIVICSESKEQVERCIGENRKESQYEKDAIRVCVCVCVRVVNVYVCGVRTRGSITAQ